MFELVEQGVEVGNDDFARTEMGDPVGREVPDETRKALRPGSQHRRQVPPGQRKLDGQPPLVVGACAAVLENQKQMRYYALAQAAGDRIPAHVTGRGHEELDDPAFIARACTPLPGGLLATDLYLEGVHCAACVWLVKKVPSLVEGAIDRLGYPVHPYRGARAAELRKRENRELLLKIGVAGAVAGNVMAIAFGLYGGFLHGIEPEYLLLFRVTSLLVATPSVFWCGSTFFRGALGSLRAKTLSIVASRDHVPRGDLQRRGVFGLGDPLRDDARGAIHALRALGYEPSILSGDHPGAEAAFAVADVFVTRPGLNRLVELVSGSRRTMRVVKRNLIFSLLYNVVAVVLAMTGFINPLLAAILMPLSSLTVIASSSLSRSFAPSRRLPWR